MPDLSFDHLQPAIPVPPPLPNAPGPANAGAPRVIPAPMPLPNANAGAPAGPNQPILPQQPPPIRNTASYAMARLQGRMLKREDGALLDKLVSRAGINLDELSDELSDGWRADRGRHDAPPCEYRNILKYLLLTDISLARLGCTEKGLQKDCLPLGQREILNLKNAAKAIMEAYAGHAITEDQIFYMANMLQLKEYDITEQKDALELGYRTYDKMTQDLETAGWRDGFNAIMDKIGKKQENALDGLRKALRKVLRNNVDIDGIISELKDESVICTNLKELQEKNPQMPVRGAAPATFNDKYQSENSTDTKLRIFLEDYFTIERLEEKLRGRLGENTVQLLKEQADFSTNINTLISTGIDRIRFQAAADKLVEMRSKMLKEITGGIIDELRDAANPVSNIAVEDKLDIMAKVFQHLSGILSTRPQELFQGHEDPETIQVSIEHPEVVDVRRVPKQLSLATAARLQEQTARMQTLFQHAESSLFIQQDPPPSVTDFAGGDDYSHIPASRNLGTYFGDTYSTVVSMLPEQIKTSVRIKQHKDLAETQMLKIYDCWKAGESSQSITADLHIRGGGGLGPLDAFAGAHLTWSYNISVGAAFGPITASKSIKVCVEFGGTWSTDAESNPQKKLEFSVDLGGQSINGVRYANPQELVNECSSRIIRALVIKNKEASKAYQKDEKIIRHLKLDNLRFNAELKSSGLLSEYDVVKTERLNKSVPAKIKTVSANFSLKAGNETLPLLKNISALNANFQRGKTTIKNYKPRIGLYHKECNAFFKRLANVNAEGEEVNQALQKEMRKLAASMKFPRDSAIGDNIRNISQWSVDYRRLIRGAAEVDPLTIGERNQLMSLAQKDLLNLYKLFQDFCLVTNCSDTKKPLSSQEAQRFASEYGLPVGKNLEKRLKKRMEHEMNARNRGEFFRNLSLNYSLVRATYKAAMGNQHIPDDIMGFFEKFDDEIASPPVEISNSNMKKYLYTSEKSITKDTQVSVNFNVPVPRGILPDSTHEKIKDSTYGSRSVNVQARVTFPRDVSGKPFYRSNPSISLSFEANNTFVFENLATIAELAYRKLTEKSSKGEIANDALKELVIPEAVNVGTTFANDGIKSRFGDLKLAPLHFESKNAQSVSITLVKTPTGLHIKDYGITHANSFAVHGNVSVPVFGAFGLKISGSLEAARKLNVFQRIGTSTLTAPILTLDLLKKQTDSYSWKTFVQRNSKELKKILLDFAVEGSDIYKEYGNFCSFATGQGQNAHALALLSQKHSEIVRYLKELNNEQNPDGSILIAKANREAYLNKLNELGEPDRQNPADPNATRWQTLLGDILKQILVVEEEQPQPH